ncbi:class II fructose-bisphosphate aldolase [Endozoicomonas elysicola]|uniref:Fructose-bisphosphate aldolase n=1 Tax=Endozoicomonas elysicola TaxID=305900 RepID=A0A081K601_9GAMM|nr:class II fructose-bisphosphate aldolase [Endozoicomonas elysicola]KEI69577.1 fructose-bisphosphate aldolase [Endozoicomonas elysicola]
MLVNLGDLLPDAAKSDYAVPCFNVFGYEDARAVVNAAEKMNRPVILAANKTLVDFMGVASAAQMISALAKEASVPVCAHLDHTYEEDIIFKGIHHGFSSVMFDGSQLPLEENIRRTRAVVDVAHACGVSVEGEIGSVPYDDIRPHIKTIATDPFEAAAFARESGVDAVAVSVGNIHRLKEPTATIDHDSLARIADAVDTPLVIHGTSGIKEEDLTRMRKGAVAKFNIGTVLRMAFGRKLRETMIANPEEFDRPVLMAAAMLAVEDAARHQLELFYGKNGG